MRDEQGHWVATSKEDFMNMKILYVENFKPGVKRVHGRVGRTFWLVYCKDEFLPVKYQFSGIRG